MITVFIRKLRPYLPVLVILTWILLHLSPPPELEDDSLLDIFVNQLRLLKLGSLSLASDSQWAKRAVPLLSWMWRALEDFVAVVIVFTLCRIVYCLYHFSWKEWKNLSTDTLFTWTVNHVPGVEHNLDKITRKVIEESGGLDKMVGKDTDRTVTSALPKKGRGPQAVIAELEPCSKKENDKWTEGKLSGTVYQDDPDHTHLMNEAFRLYTWSNPLHIGYWKKLNQCDAEVISITSKILNAPEAFGTVTSGGTESIFCAIKASLGYYGKRRGIMYPELICGTSAHAGVDKACELLGIRQVRVDCSTSDFRMSPTKVRSYITSNTIMIFAGAPSYPQGVIDPIEDLSDIAKAYDIGLHVDACLGGFVLAFWDEAPVFDFSCSGVSSMSIDTHKYGYAAKGTSCVLYRYKKLRQAQYFCYSKWSGGIYATPTLAGSRPGALVVCAWAALVSLGEDGYRERTKKIVDAAQKIADGVTKIPNIYLMTSKPSVVVCFSSDELDIYSISARMAKKGWTLNEMQSPASVHLCVTLNVAPRAETFVEELASAVEEEVLETKGGKKRGSAGIYGMAGSIPEGPVNHVLKEFLDGALSA